MIRLLFALTAVFLLASSLGAAAGPAPDARARFQYLETRLLTQEAPLRAKPWAPQERQKVEAAIAAVMQAAPGIVQRAVAYRAVRVYRTERLGSEQFAVGMVASEHVLFIADSFFATAAPGGFTLKAPGFSLARALAHLADGNGRASGTKEWVQISQPIMDSARAKAKELNLTLTELVAKGDEEVAKGAGTPTTFAAFNRSELLAQFAAALAVKKDAPVAPSVKTYVERRLLATAPPEEAARRFSDGLALVEQGKFDDAIKAYDAAIKADPGFREAYFRRAMIEKYRENWEKANLFFDQAVRASNGAPPTQLLLERGFVHLQRKQFDKAIADLTLVIDGAPGLGVDYVVRAYGMRGDAQLVTKNWVKAAADFTAVIQIDPGNSVAWRNRGRARFEVQDGPGAIEDLNRAIQLDPKDADAYFIRGYAYGSLKQYRQAKADLEEALRIAPQMQALVRPALDFVNAEIAKGR